jgi:cysteine synthase A
MINKIEKMIGSTPIFVLPKRPGMAEVMIKVESKNPGGSIKDRVALSLIEEGEKTGELKAGGTVIEPTSGNTGIGLALIAKSRGYNAIIVMPDSMSKERRDLIAAFGAKLLLTPGAKGMAGAIEEASRLAKENGYYMPNQFENMANVQAHINTTGPEIVQAAKGNLDAFVSAVGTGGTLAGVAAVLKEKIPNCMIVAVEPFESAVLSGGKAGPHKIQGIGAGFIPKILNTDIIDRVIKIKGDDAIMMSKTLSHEYGLLVGISSGAAVAAAMAVAAELGEGKRVLCIAPDTGERYLSVFGG